MTGTRQRTLLKQHIEVLTNIVEQYKDDFALPQREADLLVSCSDELRRRITANNAPQEYAQECHTYYTTARAAGFFNDDAAGKRIFAEVAACYLQIIQVRI